MKNIHTVRYFKRLFLIYLFLSIFFLLVLNKYLDPFKMSSIFLVII